jgi:hypothetical protein
VFATNTQHTSRTHVHAGKCNPADMIFLTTDLITKTGMSLMQVNVCNPTMFYFIPNS